MSNEDKIAEAGAVKEGKETSENKWAWMGAILAAVIALAPIFLKLVPEGSVAAVIIGCLVTIATLGSTYVHSRGKVKAAASVAKGLALGAAAKDPQ